MWHHVARWKSPTFRRSICPLSSGLKSKPSKKPASSRQTAVRTSVNNPTVLFFLKIYFFKSFYLSVCLPKHPFSLDFSTKNLYYAFMICVVPATSPANPIVLYYVIVTVCVDSYKLWSSILCNSPQVPVFAFLLCFVLTKLLDVVRHTQSEHQCDTLQGYLGFLHVTRTRFGSVFTAQVIFGRVYSTKVIRVLVYSSEVNWVLYIVVKLIGSCIS
jgi:hypothetical protein